MMKTALIRNIAITIAFALILIAFYYPSLIKNNKKETEEIEEIEEVIEIEEDLFDVFEIIEPEEMGRA